MSKGKRFKLVLLATGILSIVTILTAKFIPQFLAKQANQEERQERLEVKNVAKLQSTNREIANQKVGSELLQTRFNSINLELAKSNPNKFIIVEHLGESYLIYDSEGDAKLNFTTSKSTTANKNNLLKSANNIFISPVQAYSAADLFVNGINIYNWTKLGLDNLESLKDAGLQTIQSATSNIPAIEPQKIAEEGQRLLGNFVNSVKEFATEEKQNSTEEILKQLQEYNDSEQQIKSAKIQFTPQEINSSKFGKILIDILQNPDTSEEVKNVLKSNLRLFTLREAWSSVDIINILSVKESQLFNIGVVGKGGGRPIGFSFYLNDKKIQASIGAKETFSAQNISLTSKQTSQLKQLGIKVAIDYTRSPETEFEEVPKGVKFLLDYQDYPENLYDEKEISKAEFFNQQKQKVEKKTQELNRQLIKAVPKPQEQVSFSREDLRLLAESQTEFGMAIKSVNEQLELDTFTFLEKKSREPGTKDKLTDEVIESLTSEFLDYSGVSTNSLLPEPIKAAYAQSFSEFLTRIRAKAKHNSLSNWDKTVNDITLRLPIAWSQMAKETGIACEVGAYLSKGGKAWDTVTGSMFFDTLCQGAFTWFMGFPLKLVADLQKDNPSYEHYLFDTQKEIELNRLANKEFEKVKNIRDYIQMGYGFVRKPINPQKLEFAKKNIPSTVKKVNNRNPIHAEWAGKLVTIDKVLAETDVDAETIDAAKKVLEKYKRKGVNYNKKGLIDLEPFKKESFKIKGGFDGNNSKGEIEKADEWYKQKFGRERDPEIDGTWHHHTDCFRLILIDKALHDAFRHTGGDALARGGNCPDIPNSGR